MQCRSIDNVADFAGFTLDKHAFDALFSAYDPDRNLNLGMPEFIAMTLYLRSASAIFQAFDHTKTGKVTLDFIQLPIAALEVYVPFEIDGAEPNGGPSCHVLWVS